MKKFAGMIRALKKEQEKIAAVRYRIATILEEFDMLRDDCTDAWDNIETAIDALSRQQ